MKVRMIVIGGFLGAGKTTLIAKLARDLKASGVNVGLIMNDQADALVDTRYAEALGLNACEVSGGCFCCRFPDLMARADKLMDAARPQVIIAEPVGSCTDLLATVVAPLKSLYSDKFQVAPLTIMIDAERASREGFDQGTLSGYLRNHQLEEAELVVLSKADLVSGTDLDRLQEMVRGINPQARVVVYSALSGEGYEDIRNNATSEKISDRRPKDIDYVRYAEAEAELGWYNATISADFPAGTDAYSLGSEVLRRITASYPPESIAHAKVMLTSSRNAMKMSCVQGRITVDLAKGSRYAEGQGKLIVNARVVSSPEALRDSVRAGLAAALPGTGTVFETEECFSPSPPRPYHRMSG